VHSRRVAILVGAVLLACSIALTVNAAAASAGQRPHVSSIWLRSSTAYTPKAPTGATDDYHCTLLDPRVTKSSYIVSSQFFPGSAEVHHAAVYVLPPSLVALAKRDHALGKGWTCFGEGSLPGAPLADFFKTTMLSNWSPGHGVDNFPRGTGLVVPARSLIVMQVHYNTLVGDKAVKSSIVLHTVPLSTPLLKLHVQTMQAPPDIPCPAGVTGPLCDRAASVANQGQRFGAPAVMVVDGIELLCGRSLTDPPAGDSTSCTSAAATSGYIVRVAPHMHLLGVGFKVVLNPGTPQQSTVLSVPHYDFHHQVSYNLAKPVAVAAGEPMQVTCTYDPTLEQELPALRKVAPHFVTWGDGSTDEMCVGVVWISPKLPNSKNPV
jgi:Copper type II ascorbate-dependent monooxygenase, C-terminal domain